MGWRARHLLERFINHHAVTLHNVARHVDISFVRRVRDNQPAIGSGFDIAWSRVVIITRHAANFGAVARDHVGAALTHGGVDVDHAAGAEHARPVGDRSTVVAVSGAGDGDCRVISLCLPERIREHRAPSGLLLDSPLQNPKHGVCAAQRLEAAEPETAASIL